MSSQASHKLDSVSAKVHQEYFENNHLARKLKEKGRVFPGQKSFDFRSDYEFTEESQLKPVGKLEKLDRNDVEAIVRATHLRCRYHAHTIMAGEDVEIAGGPTQVRDMQKHRINKLRVDITQELDGELYDGDAGTLGGGGGRRFTGVQQTIVSPANTGLYGLINKATYVDYRNNVIDADAGPNTDFDLDGLDRILAGKHAGMVGSGPEPDLLFGTDDNVRNLIRQTEGRITSNQRNIKDDFNWYGFDGIRDTNIAANTFPMLASASWRLLLAGPTLVQFWARKNLPDYHPRTIIYDAFVHAALICDRLKRNTIFTNANG